MIASIVALSILGIGVVSIAVAAFVDEWLADRKYRREMELIDRKARGCVERMR